MFIIVELINIKNIVDKQPYNKLMHINSIDNFLTVDSV